eukprot:TRINITY_DN23817_c0_g1_i3.p1 TRINITY_DN23817_c0_g1~~TRINITY_DN23817_c0_g1_i3.p1  ORF type:complete len:313 (-),score=47.60 TRINITY_DN23817_c0_g1_i3:90-1028(-)
MASYSNDAIKFLLRHGYLDDRPQGDPIDESISKMTGDLTSFFTGQDELIRNGLILMQTFYGLDPSGDLDDHTLQNMKVPRCTMKDRIGELIAGQPATNADFNLVDKWDKNHLTWRVVKYPSNDLGEERVRQTLRRAFSVWERYADLKFTEEENPGITPDMVIKWEAGEHGDGDPFDQGGGTLAHAFFPRQGPVSGDIHFDDDERWTLGSYSGINLTQVAVHEIGHSLGLSHTNVRGAIMYPSYEGYKPNLDLAEDDIRGIQALYGPPQGEEEGREFPPPPEDEWIPAFGPGDGGGGDGSLLSTFFSIIKSLC